MVLFVSGPDDDDTIKLPNPIEVDSIGKNGKRAALMMTRGEVCNSRIAEECALHQRSETLLT